MRIGKLLLFYSIVYYYYYFCFFQVLELRERLTKLWDCLDEDQIYRENFLHAHPGCHPQTEAAIKEEIKRCDLIKRQKIQVNNRRTNYFYLFS